MPLLWQTECTTFRQVFWIHDILVRIRIRTTQPYHWLTEPDPALSVSDLQHANKKNSFFLSFFLLINFWRYTYIILHRLKVIKKSQNRGNQSFSYYIFLIDDGRILIRICTNSDGSWSRRSGLKTYGSSTLFKGAQVWDFDVLDLNDFFIMKSL